MFTDEQLQQLRQVVKEETNAALEPVKQDIGLLKQGQVRLEKKIDTVQAHVDALQETVINFHGKLEKRVSRIENHLHLPPLAE